MIDRTKCVSPAYDHIHGNISLRQLIYDGSKLLSDDERLFERYRIGISSILDRATGHSQNKKYYLKSSMVFYFNRGGYKQMGSGIICEKKFEYKKNKCRNRTYFFFLFHEPEELSRIIVNDIIKEKPIVRKCFEPKASIAK